MCDSGSNVVAEMVDNSLKLRSKLIRRAQNSNVKDSMCAIRLFVSVRDFNFVKLKKADFSSFVI